MLELNWKRSRIPLASSKDQIPSFISVVLFHKRVKGMAGGGLKGSSSAALNPEQSSCVSLPACSKHLWSDKNTRFGPFAMR